MHVLALDGAYTFDGERPRFHRVPPPTALELERLLDTLIRRITRTLVRSGALVAQEDDDAEQTWLDLDADGEDAPTQIQSASIGYRIAVAPIAGRKTLRLHTPGAARERSELAKPWWSTSSSMPFAMGPTHVLLLRASCPTPFGPAFGCSKSLPAI